jgi:acyl dehydratase
MTDKKEMKIPEHIDEIDVTDFERWVGVDLPQPEQYNYYVTPDTIRHYAYGINDYNALYLEENFAARTRFGGIIAPVGYLYSHGDGVWTRVLGNIEGITMNDNSGTEWHFYLPVRPGDIIHAHSKVHSVSKRQGRRAGPLIIVTSDTLYTNQHGEVVSRNLGSSFRFAARGVAAAGGMAQALRGEDGKFREAPEKPKWPVPTHAYRLNTNVPRWYYDHNVYWDDVEVGEEIPSYDIGILHQEHLTRYSSGNNGAMPGAGLLDDDPEWAEARGADNPMPPGVAGGPMRTPWFGTLLSRWGGPNSWVTKLTYQNREWNIVGYGVIVKGRITGKRIEDGKHLVDLDVWVENDLGIVTNPGSATVELLPNQIRPGSGL